MDRLLFPANGPRAARIVPELQDIDVGTFIPDGPPETKCGFHVVAIEAVRAYPRIMVVRIDEGFNSNSSLFQWARYTECPRADMYEVGPWEEMVGLSGDDIVFAINIPQESVTIDGEVLLLDNVRVYGEELTTFERDVELTPEQMANTYLVRHLAPLFDAYVNDAFGAAHRAAPSMVVFQRILPSAAGLLLTAELAGLASIVDAPARPAVFLLGGLKVSDGFSMMGRVLGDGTAGADERPGAYVGTRRLWSAIAEAPGVSAIGGGDTVASARRFVDLDRITFVSTGGGALIRYVSGRPLPLLEAFAAS